MRDARLEREAEIAEPARKRFTIARSRSLVSDIVHFDQTVPTCPHYREFDLRALAEVRSKAEQRYSWPVLFIKAFAILSRDAPALRESWIRYPFPHLYRHPHSVGTLAVRRSHSGEEWLFFAPFVQSEDKTLDELQEMLECFRTDAVETVFRIQYRFAFFPAPVRRIIMWLWMNWMGSKKAKKFGTFGLTTISSRGAVIQNPPGILTSTITYGPISEEGACRVTITYDHRLMDGWYVAELLERLEEILKTEIAAEIAASQS